MSSIETELQVLYNIGNAPVREYPYPHIFVRDVFPADFYEEMRRNLPPREVMTTLGKLGRVSGGDYTQRNVMLLAPEHMTGLDEGRLKFWDRLRGWLLGLRFTNTMIAKFAPYLAHRLGDLRTVHFGHEAMVIRDHTNYSLGPHTDSPSKALSFLFYLPADASREHLGTSIYLPNDPGFTCAGGPHYKFTNFQRMLTLPYVPNALFAFMKTNNSFHGVEPVEETDAQRDLLLYDVRAEPRPQSRSTT